MRFVLSYFAILVASSSAVASPLLTITCHEPKGQRVEYGVFPEEYMDAKGNGKPLPTPRRRESADGYSGVHPTFIVDSVRPKSMTVLWGDSAKFDAPKAAAKSLGVPVPAPSAREATILLFSDDQISAIEVGAQNVGVHSFFPKLGTAYFTNHANIHFGSDWSESVSLFAVCEFAWNSGDPKRSQ
ncbi:MAG: hypothetical protein QOD06_3388 [Candidatus Binatota bacterium]|nr:hypothetical protein [Candidatus Binatota bacterium]